MTQSVDVLASEGVRRQLRMLMPALQWEHPNNRQKAYVAVAWSFVREGDIEEALKLVDLLTLDYVQNVMPEQMDRDPAFAKMAEVVAAAIVDAGIHTPSYTVPGNTYALKEGQA
jgi:hypothetical protein